MSIQLNEQRGGKVVVGHVAGKPTKAGYEHFDKSLNDASGSTEGRTSCSTSNSRHAVLPLGFHDHRKALEVAEMFRKPFTKATIRYFDHTAASEARKWLGIAAPAARPRMRCEVLGGLRPARAEKP